jgi:protein-S-isoprenylcysteine O-methyltransferase Ste14
MVFLALAAWFASPALLAYTVAAWVAFHAFIVLVEERALQRLHGDPYREYRARISRWLPSRRKNWP